MAGLFHRSILSDTLHERVDDWLSIIDYESRGKRTIPAQEHPTKEFPDFARYPLERRRRIDLSGPSTSLVRVAQSRSPLEFPLDLFMMEIAPRMAPSSLLQMSRTSKLLRRTLLSRRNRALWTRSLRAIPQLPPCPEDISEPFYTALIFGQNCFDCGKNRGDHVDYVLRLRLCSWCYRNTVKEGQTILDEYKKRQYFNGYGCPPANLAWIVLPCQSTVYIEDSELSDEALQRVYPMQQTGEDLFYRPDVEAVMNWLKESKMGMQDLETELREHIVDMFNRQLHAVLIRLWEMLVKCNYDEKAFHRRWSVIKSFHRLDILPRPKYVKEYIRSYLGPPALYEDLNLPAILSSATRDVSAKLVAQLDQEARARQKSRKAAFRLRRDRRVQIYHEWYEDGNYYTTEDEKREPHSSLFDSDDDEEPLPPRPCRRDRQKMFKYYAADDDARDNLEAWGGVWLVNSKFERYEKHYKSALALLWMDEDADSTCEPSEAGLDDNAESILEVLDPQAADRILEKPYAFFLCTRCSHPPLPYPDIHDHWRKAHGDVSAFREGGPEGFGGLIRLSAWVDGRALIGEMLDAVGKSGAETTRDELDQLVRDEWIYCSCGHPEGYPDSRRDRSWAKLVHHVFAHVNWHERCTASLGKSKEPAKRITLRNDHLDIKRCITLQPEATSDADTESKDVRTPSPEPEPPRSPIEDRLAQCPQGARVVCRLCKEYVRKRDRDGRVVLERDARAIDYHMRAKHEVSFEESSIEFSKSARLGRGRTQWARSVELPSVDSMDEDSMDDLK